MHKIQSRCFSGLRERAAILTKKGTCRIFPKDPNTSNFRAYGKKAVLKSIRGGGETFGAEFLFIAKKKRPDMGEIKYDALYRRRTPRIDGSIEANLRIMWALVKSAIIYLT